MDAERDELFNPLSDGTTPGAVEENIAQNDGLRENNTMRDVFTQPIAGNLLPRIDQKHLSSRVQAAIREILAHDLLDSVSQQSNNAVTLAAAASPTSAAYLAIQRRHAKYMLIMGSVIGEFFKSTHLELSLSVFVKEMEFYFSSNVLNTMPAHVQQLSDISPLFAELNRGMTLFRIIDLVGIAPYSKFGRQLQQSFYGGADGRGHNMPDMSRNSRASEPDCHAENSYSSCTKTFLFQMLKAMEISGVFDAQSDAVVQVNSSSHINAAAVDNNTAADNFYEHDTDTQQLLDEFDGSKDTNTPPGNTLRLTAHLNPAKTRQQHILLKLKRLLQEKHDRELLVQVERVRGDEMDNVRRELDEHYRTQLLQSQLALERDYKQRCAEVTEREHQLTSQYTQRETEFEHEEHIKRSKLLLEAEKLAEHERELERRYQVRRDELSSAEARLAATQADVELQREGLGKREKKLKDLQSVFEEAERERRRQFETELEQQRKIFDDEECRLRHQIEEIMARNDFLVRENNDLRGNVAELSSVGGRAARRCDNYNTGANKNHMLTSTARHELDVTNAALRTEKKAHRRLLQSIDKNDAREVKLVNGYNSDADDDAEITEAVKKELSQLRRHYKELKQRYVALSGKNASSRAASKKRHESHFSSGSDDNVKNNRSGDRRRRNDAPNFRPEKKYSRGRRQNEERHPPAGNVATQRLLNDLTKHFKAQDALKNELAHEIDRGIQRLAIHTGSAEASTALVTPASAESSLNSVVPSRRAPAAATAVEGMDYFTHRFEASGQDQRQTKPVTVNFGSDKMKVKTDGSFGTFIRSHSRENYNRNQLNARETKFTANAAHSVEHVSGGERQPNTNAATANLADDDFSAASRWDKPEQIYEIRRLEKRLEQSMANDAAKKRRRKVHKAGAPQQTIDLNNTASAVAFDAQLQPHQEQQQRSASSPSTIMPMPTPSTTATSTEISLGFEDIQLRQLVSPRNRLDEYMFRPLPPLEIPKILSNPAKARIFGVNVSAEQIQVKLPSDSDAEQKKLSSVDASNKPPFMLLNIAGVDSDRIDTLRLTQNIGGGEKARNAVPRYEGFRDAVGDDVKQLVQLRNDSHLPDTDVAGTSAIRNEAKFSAYLAASSEDDDSEDNYINILRQNRAVAAASPREEQADDNAPLFTAPAAHEVNNTTFAHKLISLTSVNDDEPSRLPQGNWFSQIRQQQQLHIEREENLPNDARDEDGRRRMFDRVKSNNGLNIGEVLEESQSAVAGPGNDRDTASENDEDAW